MHPSPIASLLIWSGLMAITTFLPGLLPLVFTLSARHLSIVTHLGTGLLSGTALSIVLPEGIAMLSEAHHHENGGNEEENEGHDNGLIAIALILGFASMYLLDALLNMSRKSKPTRYRNVVEEGFNLDPIEAEAGTLLTGDEAQPANIKSRAKPNTKTTTVGLTLHAITDGIALGASSATPSSFSLLIVIAIMLHKAPAAFGLTATLLSQGLKKKAIRWHLLLFSLAAPLGAIATWALVQFVSVRSGQIDNGWTGEAMIFSAGTFLFVAMHSLQHLSEVSKASLIESLVTTGGMLLPLLTRIGHVHVH